MWEPHDRKESVMVAIRRLSSTVAACAFFLIFPALASAHLLAVSASPSQCVSPLNGQYTATVTITETYFGGTVEYIPVGQNVHELSSSTDRGNTGLNQNYFTQGAVGTQTGPADMGQPTSFTSPASGGAATQHFTVTTSVPETYVLGNSYMRSPSSVTITAPRGGCTPPPPPPSPPTVKVTVTTVCTVPLDGTYSAAVDITSDQAFNVPAGTASGSHGVNFLTPAATGLPSSIKAGDTTFTLTGLTQSVVYVIGAPGGNVASISITAPIGGCTPPPPPPPPPVPPVHPTCAAGQTLTGGVCLPVTTAVCLTGQIKAGGYCIPEPCRVHARSAYRVRAGEVNTVMVSVGRSGVRVRVTLPGGKSLTGASTTHGTITFTVRPKHAGMIYVRSSSCTGTAKVKVFAPKVPTTRRPPSFTG
jgi:hypothetical protein